MRTRRAKAVYVKEKRMKLSEFQKRVAVIICVLTAILSLILVFNVTTSAHNTYDTETVYTNHYINDGDTLWDIANENYTPEYGSFKEYLNEIRSLNHLTSDVIHAGEYLVIPTTISR